MKNKIIDVFRVANRLVSITVEHPDFSDLKINEPVWIGDKEYRVHSVPMIRPKFESNSSVKVPNNTFTIDDTDEDLMGKQARFSSR